MDDIYWNIIRSHSWPQQPVRTDLSARLQLLPAIRVVLFDIYGTMLVSGSGDVGTASQDCRAEAAGAALAAVGLSCADGGRLAADCLAESIRVAHCQSCRGGVEYPEVDILSVWDQTLERVIERGGMPPTARAVDRVALAVHHEVRANPVWPMPGLSDVLAFLRRRGLTLGVISNAQFYTPLLFPALLGRTLVQLGFDRELLVFSYRSGQAKPARCLFESASNVLFSRGIATNEVLYIGNDMVNDVLGAHLAGMRTALFAGDRRSLRTRADDARVAGIEPDLVVTHLNQIVTCLCSEVVETENEREQG